MDTPVFTPDASQITTQVCPDGERDALLTQMYRVRGQDLGHGFMGGQSVEYRGITYGLLDVDAWGSDTRPVLVSDRWLIVRGVKWENLRGL